MAETKQITIDIVLNNQDSINSLKDIKESIKLVNNELLKTEEGTQSYNELSAAAGKLKDKIADLNDTLKLTQGSGLERFKNSLSTIREGFTNLDPGKLKIGIQGVTQAFGGLGKAIAATGIGLLVVGVIKLIQNFDELKQSGGLIGAVFTAIGDTVQFLIQGLKDLSDTFKLTNFAAAEAADAEKKYGEGIRETNVAIGVERRKQLVLTGQLSQEEAARQNAKEKFVTDFLKVQADARAKILEDSTEAGKAKIEEQRLASIKLLQNAYTSELLTINKGEKDKQSAIDKAASDAAKKKADEAAAAAAKLKATQDKANDDFVKQLKDNEAKRATEEEKIIIDAENAKIELRKKFEAQSQEDQKETRQQFNIELLSIDENAIKASNDLKARLAKEADDAAKAAAEKAAKEKVQAEKTAIENAEKEINGGLTQIEFELFKLESEGQLTTAKEIELTQAKYAKLIKLAKLKGENVAILEQEQANVIGQIQDASRQQQINNAAALGNALISIASSLTEFGKKSEKQKIKDQRNVTLAGIALSTGLGIAQAVSDGMKVGITPIEKGIAIASGIALVLANIAKARKVVRDADASIAKLGAGGPPPPDLSAGISGGGGAASGGSTAPQTPSFNLFGTGGSSNNLGSQQPQAIQAYDILILKYPEKSVFFANRIEEIKQLQNIK
jgi:hypothetical protein